MSAGDLHAVEVAAAPDAALEALVRTAEPWGADLDAESGEGAPRLRLPVVAGLRRGWVEGSVTALPVPGGSRLTFREERGELYLHAPAVVVLTIAGLGGLLTVLWPFFPRLIAIAPFGAVLALSGWFLILSRLRSSGPRELLEAIAAEIGRDQDPSAEVGRGDSALE